MSQPESEIDTLYYDGACPLCSREIKKLQQLKSSPIECVDVNTLDNSVDAPSRQELLRRLHLKTDSGKWLVGLEANIYAWRGTPFYWVWRLLKLPLIYPVANWAYELWARKRFENLESKKT